ncbi:MAG: HEAT repeat domain-containing protein, partial [Propionicimonas sp.]
THPDPAIRMRAALAPSGVATADLLAAAVGEPVVGVRDALVLALARQPDIVEVAVARLEDPDPTVREVLVRTLGKLRNPACLPALARRLDDTEPAVVAAALDALGRIGDPAAAPALAALLGGGRASVRDVTDALVALGPEAVAAVAERLGDPDAAVGEHATEVLERLGADPGLTFT